MNMASPRNFEPQKISKVLKDFSDQKSLNKGLKNAKVEELWHKEMGQNISAYTLSINLSGKKLFVKMKSSTLKEELRYGEAKIIKLLNEKLEEEIINKVIFH